MTIQPKHEPILNAVAGRHRGATHIDVRALYAAAHELLRGSIEPNPAVAHQSVTEHKVGDKHAKTVVVVASDGLFVQATQVAGKTGTYIVCGTRYAQEAVNQELGITAIHQWS